MNVLLFAADLSTEPVTRHLIAQARLFRERGDAVRLVLSAPPDSVPDELVGIVASPPLDSEGYDATALPVARLYIYHHTSAYPLLDSLKQRDQGPALVHDHGTAPPDWLPAHYADLCLVDDAQRRDTLLHDWGLAPERVHVLPDPGSAQYQHVLEELVTCILAGSWPPSPPSRVADALQQPARQFEVGTQDGDPSTAAAADAALNLARGQTDIMYRGYEVRSRVPLLGGAIVWLRRNLTSHLREPYLDPTLERQVAFNRTLLDWMSQVGARLEALEDRLQAMEAQLGTVRDRAAGAGPAGDPDRTPVDGAVQPLPEEDADAG